jgi:hypothetical protein
MRFGHYRVCYEQALSRDPRLSGYWVARVLQTSTNQICRMEVVDTNLPPELDACLRERIRAQSQQSVTAGRFELAFLFSPR